MKKTFLIGAIILIPTMSFAAIAATSSTSTSSDNSMVTAATSTSSTPTATTTSSGAIPSSPTVAVATTTPTEDLIVSLEHSYYLRHDGYLQVLPGDILPPRESGTVKSNLGQDLPTNVRIDVYESPKGIGYQVMYQDTQNSYSFGFGPEAATRTFTIPLTAVSATSTGQ